MISFEKGWRLLLFFIVLIFIISVRIPFLGKVLSGEEGSHAALLIHNANDTDIIIGGIGPHFVDDCLPVVGRLDGADILARPGRNIAPYCIISKLVEPIARSYWVKSESFEEKTQLARGIFLGIATLGLLASTALCFLVSLRLSALWVMLPYLILSYVATTPLSVGSTIQPQLDGTIGLSLLCLSFLALYLGGSDALKNLWRYLLFFISGFLISLCKNEWPIAFLGALIGCLVIYSAAGHLKKLFPPNPISHQFERRPMYFETSILLAGLLCGIVFCIALSPMDYFSGFGLMKGVSSRQFSSWQLLMNYQDLLRPLGVCLGIALLFTYMTFGISRQIFVYLPFIYFIFSMGIAFGFVWSGWLGDGFPRYYAPPLMIFALYCVALLPKISARYSGLWAVTGTVFLSFLIFQNLKILKIYHSSSISITVPGDTNWVKSELTQLNEISKSDPRALLITHSSMLVYFPDANFISRDFSGDGDVEILKNYPDQYWHIHKN